MALLEDRDGVLWIGSRGGLVRIEPNGTAMSPVPLAHAAPVIGHLLQTRDGRVWVAVRQELFVFADERRREKPERITIEPRIPPPSPLSSSQDQAWEIEALAEGQQGDVWIGTRWGLIRRDADGRMQHVAIRPTSEDDRVYHLAVDREGRVWVTHWGLAHRPGVHFGVYVFWPDNTSDQTSNQTSDQTAGQTSDQTNDTSVPLHTRASRNGHRDTSVAQTRRRGHLRDRRRSARRCPRASGPAAGGWHRLDRHEAGIVHIGPDGRAVRYDDRNGLGLPIYWLARDAHGSLWLGTRGNGLIRFDVNGFVTFTAREGLTSGEVAEIVEDATGAICVAGTDPAIRN